MRSVYMCELELTGAPDNRPGHTVRALVNFRIKAQIAYTFHKLTSINSMHMGGDTRNGI